jgi:hypothetical protein
MMLDEKTAAVAERLCLDVEIDVIPEPLAQTGREIARVRLRRTK